MKRAAFGFLWFLVIWFGTLVIGGAVVGSAAGSGMEATSMSEAFSKGQEAGAAAGAEFGRKYGGVIFLGALVISIGGTILGILPGTKSRKKDSADELTQESPE
ncbi:MAG: hypothetical protein EPO31_15270 [Gammaproteobacteria bacterium]|nr:MAG: hypothetical protein EPO31_15270 [Gammaproteobacteria bacterium]